MTRLAAACLAIVLVAAVDERERLERRQTAFFEAVSSGDPEQTAAFYTEEAVMHVAGRPPVVGRAAIRQFYGTMFTFLAASRATPDTFVVSDSGDMAYSIGRSENEFKGAQGPASHAGKYLIVWQRQAGEWLIAAYSISSDQ